MPKHNFRGICQKPAVPDALESFPSLTINASFNCHGKTKGKESDQWDKCSRTIQIVNSNNIMWTGYHTS